MTYKSGTAISLFLEFWLLQDHLKLFEFTEGIVHCFAIICASLFLAHYFDLNFRRKLHLEMKRSKVNSAKQAIFEYKENYLKVFFKPYFIFIAGIYAWIVHLKIFSLIHPCHIPTDPHCLNAPFVQEFKLLIIITILGAPFVFASGSFFFSIRKIFLKRLISNSIPIFFKKSMSLDKPVAFRI